jgi:hypothetical protein
MKCHGHVQQHVGVCARVQYRYWNGKQCSQIGMFVQFDEEEGVVILYACTLHFVEFLLTGDLESCYCIAHHVFRLAIAFNGYPGTR